MSTQDKNKNSEENKPRRPLPQSDISAKRKEIFDLSRDKNKPKN